MRGQEDEHVTTDLEDDELELIVIGLAIVGLQSSKQSVATKAVSLIEKLGFKDPDLGELKRMLEVVE